MNLQRLIPRLEASDNAPDLHLMLGMALLPASVFSVLQSLLQLLLKGTNACVHTQTHTHTHTHTQSHSPAHPQTQTWHVHQFTCSHTYTHVIISTHTLSTHTRSHRQAPLHTYTPMQGYVRMHTNLGDLNIELHCDIAPRTCENFLGLAGMQYFDGTVFHRSIKNFMIQVRVVFECLRGGG